MKYSGEDAMRKTPFFNSKNSKSLVYLALKSYVVCHWRPLGRSCGSVSGVALKVTGFAFRIRRCSERSLGFTSR